ncbi:unnamed protein product [Microthlaspi erraticum]|uniref:Uncharacterized protein n=1 Tax=Microthlaspi erraticum TaxID=1685480 RepID=A0A6D2K2Z8_9BRAS|nr:unnamed protein product [Microthlaspi erraticum]
MDFIKTSSPRALSELTLQHNWIGIIWMSRSEDMIKLMKTRPNGFIEHSRPEPRTPADRGTNIPRSSRAHHSHPAKSTAELTSRPEKQRPTVEPFLAHHHKLCTTAPREQEGNSSRPRGTTHVPRPTHPSDQEGFVPRPAHIHRPKLIHPSDPVGRTQKLSATIVPTVAVISCIRAEFLPHDPNPNCSLRKEPIGWSHSFQEDRIKEVMLILNGPIRFSYPAAWKMDQWKGAIQAEWIMMDGAAVGVPQHHWSTRGRGGAILVEEITHMLHFPAYK